MSEKSLISDFEPFLAIFRLKMTRRRQNIYFQAMVLLKKLFSVKFLIQRYMICLYLEGLKMHDKRDIYLKCQNPKNGCKNFCPNFWEMHGGSFFLFFHPDDESSEKKTFAKNGYGSTVSYPTNLAFGRCYCSVGKLKRGKISMS